jgi:hypothetical protein
LCDHYATVDRLLVAEFLFSATGVLLCGSLLVLPDFDFIPPFDLKSLISNEELQRLWWGAVLA